MILTSDHSLKRSWLSIGSDGGDQCLGEMRWMTDRSMADRANLVYGVLLFQLRLTASRLLILIMKLSTVRKSNHNKMTIGTLECV